MKRLMKIKAKHETEQNVIDAVCANTEIDIPDEMIDSQIDSMIRDMDMQMRYQGNRLKYLYAVYRSDYGYNPRAV